MEDPAKCEQVAILKKAEKKGDINGSPSDPKSEDYAITEGPPVVHQVIETTSVRSDTGKLTERQQEKEDEAVAQSTVKEASTVSREKALSVSMVSSADCCLTQEPRENKQDSTVDQRDRSNQKCQSGKLKEMYHEVPVDKYQPSNIVAKDKL